MPRKLAGGVLALCLVMPACTKEAAPLERPAPVGGAGLGALDRADAAPPSSPSPSALQRLPADGSVDSPAAGDAPVQGDGSAAVAGEDAGVSTLDPRQGEPDLRCQADPTGPQLTDYSKPGPYTVGIYELTLSDIERPIEATAEHPAAPQRTLATRVYYPASAQPLFGLPAPLASGAPFPMLMYSHGYSSNRDESTSAGAHAASHGYLVVAPNFPLTSLLANGGAPDTKDIPNQPGDISFLIDQMLMFSEDPGHLFAGAVDAERIGALGVSAGGLTTLLVSLHATYHDPRVRAAIPVAPLASFFERPFYHATRSIPLLLVHGDMDAFLDYGNNGRRAFDRASPHARLITVEKGSHAAFALPIDGALQQLIAGLVVPPEWSLDNPDAMGCAAVGETLQGTGLAVLETLEGPHVDHGIGMEGKLVCAGDELTMPAMGIERQRSILAQAAVAFFDAHLGDGPERRRDGCRYLLHELPKDPAVTLE